MTRNKKSVVADFVEELFRAKDEEQLFEQGEIRMSIPLSRLESNKLAFWAKEFGFSRSRFASELLTRALSDVEHVAGVTDSSKDYQDYYDKLSAVESEEESK